MTRKYILQTKQQQSSDEPISEGLCDLIKKHKLLKRKGILFKVHHAFPAKLKFRRRCSFREM